MKISKLLVLTLFVSLLAIAVLSQNSPNNNITLETTQSCNTIFYEQPQDVYGYITRYTNTYGNCLSTIEYTNCLNTTGPNTDCLQVQENITYSCVTGEEPYQVYEKTGTTNILLNRTECKTSKFTVVIDKGFTTERKEINFSSWGVCVNSTENGCVVITCGSQHGGSAVNGIFNGCDGGKSCQKFLFCNDGIKVLYKASRRNFVEKDPTYHLPQLNYKEVEQ